MARLTLADVQNGKAIPQPGDIVGNLQYRGRDPSDLAQYQPLDGSAALSGSIFDLERDGAQAGRAGTSLPEGAGPSLSGVKMLLPDIPFTFPVGTTPGQPPQSPGAVTLAAAQDFGTDPTRFPQTILQPMSPSRTPVVPATDHGASNQIGGRSVDPVQQALDTVQRTRDAAVDWAESKVGNEDYKFFGTNPDVGGRSGKYLFGRAAAKCNIFAGDAYGASGVNLRDPTNPEVYLTADVWGNPTSKIPGFSPVAGNNPQPGDILSNGKHVAIYDPGPNNKQETISAADWWNDNKVVHNDWGFRGTEGGKPIVIWRYVAPPLESRLPEGSSLQSKAPY